MSSSDTKTLQWPNHREGSKISDPIRFEEGDELPEIVVTPENFKEIKETLVLAIDVVSEYAIDDVDENNAEDSDLESILSDLITVRDKISTPEELNNFITKHPEWKEELQSRLSALSEEDKFFPGQEAQWTEDEHRVLRHGGKYKHCPICFPDQEGMLLEEVGEEGVGLAYSGGTGENVLGGDPEPFDANIPPAETPTDLQNVTPFSQQQYTPTSSMTGYGQGNPSAKMEEELEPQIDADAIENYCGYDCCKSMLCKCGDCTDCTPIEDQLKEETSYSADDEYVDDYVDSAACSEECCYGYCECGDCDYCQKPEDKTEVKDPREREKETPKELSPEAQKVAGTDEASIKEKKGKGMPKIEVKVSDKITILGKTGSGKTNLIKVLITDIFKDYEFVFLDSLGNFAEYEGKPNIEYHLVTPSNTEEVDQIIYAAMERGNCMVVMDEVDRYNSKPGTMLNELVNVGRNYEAGGIFAGRRTADISKDILANSAFIFTFQHILPQDLDVLIDWFAQPEETFRDLQEYEAILFNNGVQVWQGIVPEKPTTTPSKKPNVPKSKSMSKKGKGKEKDKGPDNAVDEDIEPEGESAEKDKIKEKKPKGQGPPAPEGKEPEAEPEEETTEEEAEEKSEEEARVPSDVKSQIGMRKCPDCDETGQHEWEGKMRPCDTCGGDVYIRPSDYNYLKRSRAGGSPNERLYEEEAYGGEEGVFECADCDTIISLFDTPTGKANVNSISDEEVFNQAYKELNDMVVAHQASHAIGDEIPDDDDEDFDDEFNSAEAADEADATVGETDIDSQIAELQKKLQGLEQPKTEEALSSFDAAKDAGGRCSICGVRMNDARGHWNADHSEISWEEFIKKMAQDRSSWGDMKEEKERAVWCGTCGGRFENGKELFAHQKKTGCKNAVEGTMEKEPEPVEESQPEVKSEGAFKCDQCGEAYKYQKELLNHIPTHVGA